MQMEPDVKIIGDNLSFRDNKSILALLENSGTQTTRGNYIHQRYLEVQRLELETRKKHHDYQSQPLQSQAFM
jgi:hypothetical protein